MKKIALILILLVTITACKSSNQKKVVTKKTRTTKQVTKTKKNNQVTTKPNATTKVINVVDYAKTFEGVRYQYGGTSKSGMACSGLVYTAFSKANKSLPRTTKELSKTGNWIDIKQIQVGDLVFFATSKNSRTVNHVGIVTTARTGYVEFIHASTSKGVMVSSLAERYWYLAYVQARRVM